MDMDARIEQGLVSALERVVVGDRATSLEKATRHAVLAGGARVRPRVCLSVAAACGEDDPRAADGAAAAIELLHCASLVHDDLPCFDDAKMRRGRPSVHQAFGERLAILAGDALIVLAFQTLAERAAASPARLAPLLAVLGNAAGLPSGIVAGQAMECESGVELTAYHRAKTGALFAAATMAGAVAAGAEAEPWRALGERIGQAYQVVDDIRDAVGDVDQLGKPCGQDERLGRPSSARELGIEQAAAQFDTLMAGIIDAIPECPGATTLRRKILVESRHLLPAALTQPAA